MKKHNSSEVGWHQIWLSCVCSLLFTHICWIQHSNFVVSSVKIKFFVIWWFKTMIRWNKQWTSWSRTSDLDLLRLTGGAQRQLFGGRRELISFWLQKCKNLLETGFKESFQPVTVWCMAGYLQCISVSAVLWRCRSAAPADERRWANIELTPGSAVLAAL